ncbi:MAG: type II toxin-antitoxin system PemK/MazF family toxin [bacterium]
MHKAGDIILTPFPFTDLSGNKVRPALVLGAQSGGDDVTVCFISSNVSQKVHKLDVLVDSTEKSFQKTGLKLQSIIKITKIATLDKAVVLGKIGVLDAVNRKKVKEVLGIYFGI